MPKRGQEITPVTTDPSRAVGSVDVSGPPAPEPLVVDEGLSDAAPKAGVARSRETKKDRLERLADTFNRVEACWYPEDHPEFGKDHVHLTEAQANDLAEEAIKELGEIVGRTIDMTADRATFGDYVDTCKRLAAKCPSRG